MVRLPSCGSSLCVQKYVGHGDRFPTIAWVKDDEGQTWMVELVCPAERTHIPLEECKQQRGEEFLSQNDQQQKLEKYQNQEDSQSSTGETRTSTTKQTSPAASPPSKEKSHSSQTKSCQEESGNNPKKREETRVPQAYRSHWEAQRARRPDTWRDKWSRSETVAYFCRSSRNREDSLCQNIGPL